MILYKTGQNRQTANYRWYPEGIPYSSWKKETNIVVIPKNVSNKESGNSNSDCVKSRSNCFKAHPMKHYRKQLTTIDTAGSTSYSRNSLIGSLDKPGNNIVTIKKINDSTSELNELCDNNILLHQNIHIFESNDCKNNSSDKYYEASLNKVVCVGLSPPALVLKPATTNLSKNYSSSNKEYLYKKCKTFDQNSMFHYKQNSNQDNFDSGINYVSNIKNDEYNIINAPYNCCNTIGYSNHNYKTQGPISSSARTFSKKYQSCDNKKICNSALLKTDYNVFGTDPKFDNKLQLPNKFCCNINGGPIRTGIRFLK